MPFERDASREATPAPEHAEEPRACPAHPTLSAGDEGVSREWMVTTAPSVLHLALASGGDAASATDAGSSASPSAAAAMASRKQQLD